MGSKTDENRENLVKLVRYWFGRTTEPTEPPSSTRFSFPPFFRFKEWWVHWLLKVDANKNMNGFERKADVRMRILLFETLTLDSTTEEDSWMSAQKRRAHGSSSPSEFRAAILRWLSSIKSLAWVLWMKRSFIQESGRSLPLDAILATAARFTILRLVYQDIIDTYQSAFNSKHFRFSNTAFKSILKSSWSHIKHPITYPGEM